jgi:hypothetical protein
MASVAERKPKQGGLLSTLVELAISFGGYYLLRACGVGVFWALTVPGIVVAGVAVTVTMRRRRIDLIGLLVLIEIVATIGLSLATMNARIAAVREPVYVIIGGVFCLATLCYRTPLTHVSAASIATFGNPKREEAFQRAWQDVPAYRWWQRLLTAAIGSIMIGTAVVRTWLLYSAPEAQLAHAINISNLIGLAMIAAIVLVSMVLIQAPRKIIDELART